MQTDYAQIMPIVLPVPKAGPVAPVSAANANGKTPAASTIESAAVESGGGDDSSGEPSEKLSAFDQALAQMMMVQVQAPTAKPVPQAPSQQSLATNPIDITAALDALQPGPAPALAAAVDAGSLPKAPEVDVAQANPVPQIPSDEGAGIQAPDPAPMLAPIRAPIQAANFAESEPLPAKVPLNDPTQTRQQPNLAFAESGVAKQVRVEVQEPQAATAQVQAVDMASNLASLSSPEGRADVLQISDPDIAAVGPSVPVPAQASTDRAVQAPILQAMGNAVSDPTAYVTGSRISQPSVAPSPADLTTVVPVQSQSPQIVAAQSQSLEPTQSALQSAGAATTQALSGAQTLARETSQTRNRAIATPITTNDVAPASGIVTSLAPIAIAASGEASKEDTGGAFEDAPFDLSENVAAKATQSEIDASTDIFGAPLPLEGRVTQASLQQSSSSPLSTPATAPHLAAEISRKFDGKSARFDISLTPEGLGKVDVKITINARGEVSAAMKFDNPQAAAELKGRAAELQRALEQSGFSLSRDGISFTDGQGQGFNAPQQQAGQQDWQETARRAAQSRMFQDSNDLADAAALRVAEASSAYSRRSITGVDVRI